MSVPDLSAKLPPPHDEEPAQLRSDILDELQDHLSCAAERERRRLQMSDQPADPSSVWAAVIERFGDPSALARRLWFDAMKGRLMTQRVLIGAVIALTVLMGFMVVGSWRMTSILSAVVEQNQKATTAILERLGNESPATVSISPEWISVKYRLVQGTKDGPPVVGQKVGFHQIAANGAGRLHQVSEVTNSEGIADFGLLPYGTYNLAISSASVMMGESITLRPGRPIDEKIVVPNPVKIVHLKFEYSRPDLTNWKWRDQEQLQRLLGRHVAGMSIEQLKEMITPCLCVKYGPQHPFEVDGRNWGSFAASKTLMVTPDGTFICGSNSTQQQMTVSSAAVESVSVPAWEMNMQAEWYFRSGGTVDEFGLPGKDVYYRPLADCLDPVFTAENRRNAESSPDKMPVILKLESATDPQVVRFPVNHPALIDGTGFESAPYLGGFGGFNQ